LLNKKADKNSNLIRHILHVRPATPHSGVPCKVRFCTPSDSYIILQHLTVYVKYFAAIENDEKCGSSYKTLY